MSGIVPTLALLLMMIMIMSSTNAAVSSPTSLNTTSVQNGTKMEILNSIQSGTTIGPNISASTVFSFAQMLKNSTDENMLDDSQAWEESHSEEFLETINNGTLTRGAKVQEVKTQWNTNVGDEEAEATE
ncbi:hypothetical protein niasHS_009168 [Heterodera schachtii]|uniref:Uncharacterized protein n=1 Tax=Heterodera schachtii TaxID=97005 RepID=A0ABD2JE38_HETSC